MMPDDHVAAHAELSSYINREGLFGDPDIMSMTEDGHKYQVPTYQFWNQEGENHNLTAACTYASQDSVAHSSGFADRLTMLCHAGYEVPVLARIGQRVTSLVSSAGACERNWSTYDFIHSKKRNRLHPDRANDLVYVFTNSRLIHRFKEPEKFAEWVQEIASDDDDDDDDVVGEVFVEEGE